MAASTLTVLRRVLIERLSQASAAIYQTDRRRSEQPQAQAPYVQLTYHANVANRLAEQVYRDHGVTGTIEPAPEIRRPQGEVTVMTTRYCLRRELGHCLRTPEGREWAEPLTLSAPGLTLHPHFDCTQCRMHITL
ncbi:MAG: hypothetical protein K2M97_08060 [Muribaculaceae bacterium]|nr:hypothetical protein [Muribaculaceae bacterium]